MRDEIPIEPLHLHDGKLAAPVAPGLGITLAPDLEQRYPYRPGSVYRILGNEKICGARVIASPLMIERLTRSNLHGASASPPRWA